MLTIWILVMTKLVWMNILPVCQWNWILYLNIPEYFLCISRNKLVSINFQKYIFWVPISADSKLGPHWVPIGSPFWTKLSPRGKWEQCSYYSLALIPTPILLVDSHMINIHPCLSVNKYVSNHFSIMGKPPHWSCQPYLCLKCTRDQAAFGHEAS